MTRIFDIIFSLIGLIIFMPLFIIIMIVLKFTGEGEIFFFQKRVGLNLKEFNIIKFATMLKNSPNIETKTLTIKNDPRILPIGHFLRQTKINELPQLINIILGDMSLIGPRPLTKEALKTYDNKTQKLIFSIKPGLSGIASIIFRNEEDLLSFNNSKTFYNKTIAPYKCELDIWYIKNKSIKNYFLCIFITIWIVVFPKSKIVWKLFKNLSKPPCNLKTHIN